MRYFTDIIATLPMDHRTRIGIDGTVGPITDRINSHKGSWSRLLAMQLRDLGFQDVEVVGSKESRQDDAWEDYDVLILEHGMEFRGQVFNMFGGLTDEVVCRLWRLANFPGRIISADQPMPSLQQLLMKRKEDHTLWAKKELGEALEKQRANIDYFDRVYPGSGIMVGDSHILSVARPGYEISRNDGKTLYGATQSGIDSFFEPGRSYTHLTVYFGNIDIRHHLMRQEHAPNALLNLVEALALQLVLTKIPNIELIAPLYIEDESRVLPKTGWYKDTPFYGTWEQRETLRVYMTQLLKYYAELNGWTLWEWPKTFLNTKGQLSFDVMEGSKSVHLSRQFYRTDYNTGQPNPILEIGSHKK